MSAEKGRGDKKNTGQITHDVGGWKCATAVRALFLPQLPILGVTRMNPLDIEFYI